MVFDRHLKFHPISCIFWGLASAGRDGLRCFAPGRVLGCARWRANEIVSTTRKILFGNMRRVIARLCPLLVLCGFVLPAATQPQLRITSPAEGAVLSPGEKITVTVVPSPGVTPALVGVVGEDMDFSATRTNPPWEFAVTVPAGIKLGTHMIAAVGRGEAELMQSPPVHVDVERREAPLKIVPSSSVLNLQVGDEIPLELTGMFRNGAKADLSESTRTFYKSETGPSPQ